MSLDETYLQEAEDRLAAVSPPLRDALRESLADLTAGLTDAQLRLFVDEGLELASRSLRSWEAGADYFRIAPGLLRQLDEAGFREWAAGGRPLAPSSSPPPPAPRPPPPPSEPGRLARVLEGISDRSADLAAACLDAAPGAGHNLTRAEVAAFLAFAAALSAGAWPAA